MQYQIEQQICGIDYKNKYAVSIRTTNMRYRLEQPICGID